ncbi:MAG TPA: tetratricopeptide repeat protein [Chloroflexota bacterium]
MQVERARRSSPAWPRGLLAQPTALVGRERELEAARARLLCPDVRLLTMTGPAGTGKTRLALAVAAELRPAFGAGALFVDLAPIADPALACPTIARTLGLRDGRGQAAGAWLQRCLADKQLLLVLDNFEQVLPAAADVAGLLAACRFVKILVTSREPLRLRWEHRCPVPPLALPDLAALPAPDLLAQVPSVALFVERARAVNPAFALTAENARSVAELCVRLDGLPLAIELAAPQSDVLPAASIVADLNQRGLDALGPGPRDLPTRQRTLRDAIGWSYQLLGPEEQALFRRLAVFVGDIAPEAACHVAAEPGRGSVSDGLAALARKSLLRREESADGRPRFRMLATIREHALERLAASGEEETTRRRHAEQCLRLAETAEAELTGPCQRHWLDRLEREHDNLRAALAWSLEQGEVETGLRLAGAVWPLWYRHGHLSEGSRWLEMVLTASLAAPAELRAKALAGAGLLAADLGGHGRARSLLEESLDLSRSLGDSSGVGHSLSRLGLAALLRGEHAAARALLDESLALFRALGDRRGSAYALNQLGLLAIHRGAYAQARVPLEESLELFRELDDPRGVGFALNNLGLVAIGLGDPARATALLEESLAVYQELGDRRNAAECLEGLARAAAAADRPEGAARLFGAAEALRETIGAPLLPLDRGPYERAVARVRAALGDGPLAEAWAAGRSRPLADVLADAPARGVAAAPATRSAGRGLAVLTRREREVAGLIRRGLTNREIAGELVITPATVERHVANILNKLALGSRSQVAVWAVEHGLACQRSG